MLRCSALATLGLTALLDITSAFVGLPLAGQRPGLPFTPSCTGTRLQHVLAPLAAAPQNVADAKVQLQQTTHDLYFVDSVKDIQGTIDGSVTPSKKSVEAYELSNDMGMKVTAMKEGGNMVQVTKNGVDYVWDNKEGATYYGADTNAFPLTRGLILHGGIRFAAVTAEHGLYYDTEWNASFEESEDGLSKSIVLSITDSAEQRGALNDPLSQELFSIGTGPMSKYPVTDLTFTYRITLKAGEEFVRLQMSVNNDTPRRVNAEAWLPMTFPIDESSQIISPQKFRLRKDEWVFPTEPNVVKFDAASHRRHILEWPGSGIYYDWPSMDGAMINGRSVGYHATSLPNSGKTKGKGVAFVTDNSVPHFTKLWSWGNRANFTPKPDSTERGDVLAMGRPAKEYYEPWSSGFNPGFFQSAQFEPFTKSSWTGCLVPIDNGMDGENYEALCLKVEETIEALDVPTSPAIHNVPRF